MPAFILPQNQDMCVMFPTHIPVLLCVCGNCFRVCLSGEVKGLKAQCNSLADAAQAEKFELLAAKQENERLQDQIVQVSTIASLAAFGAKATGGRCRYWGSIG